MVGFGLKQCRSKKEPFCINIRDEWECWLRTHKRPASAHPTLCPRPNRTQAMNAIACLEGHVGLGKKLPPFCTLRGGAKRALEAHLLPPPDRECSGCMRENDAPPSLPQPFAFTSSTRCKAHWGQRARRRWQPREGRGGWL